MKPNYIIIPLITILTAVFGGWLTSGGMKWYKTIKLPDWTPPGSFIGAVWTIIFILSTISALIAWNKTPHNYTFWWIIGTFLVNAILNVFWSYLFFNQHLIGPAIFEAALLGLSVIALIVFIWPIAYWAALLLIPYAAWVVFATYLTYAVWFLNK